MNAIPRFPIPSLPERPVRILPLLVLALLLPSAAVAQSVTVRGGNVFYRASESAQARQLTSAGVDREPRLSPDGRRVAFIRGTPGDSVETATGYGETTELWTIRVDGSDARRWVRGRASDEPARALAQLRTPQWSPDGQRVYFQSSAWVTSGAVHALDLAAGTERFVAPGNSLEVVPRGEFAGHLLVEQHRYFLAGGSYDWIWLLTPDGRAVDPVGEDETAIEEFRAMYVDP